MLIFIDKYISLSFKRFHIEKNLKFKLFQLIPLILIASVLEILSIGMLIPILAYFIEVDQFTVYGLNEIQNLIESFILDTSLNKLLMIIIFLFILKNIFLLIIAYYRYNVNNLIAKNISQKLYRDYINSDFSNIFLIQTSNIIKNLTTETTLYSRYIFSLLILITEIIVLLFLFGFLLYINFKITIILIILISFLAFIFNLLSKKIIINWSKKREYLENLRLKNIQEVFSGFMTVKIFELEKTFIKDFIIKNNFFDYIKKERFVGEIPRHFLEIFLLLIILLISMSTKYTDVNQRELFVLISLFAVFFIRMLPSINKILISITSMKYCLNSINLISNEINRFQKIEKKSTHDYKQNSHIIQFNQEIKFENICFNFTKEKKFFERINFKIKKNSIFGISGPSGSGKSTLINIITGLLKPNSGKVFIDGKYANINSHSWRRLFSYVPQNIFIFEDTIKNNILLNNVNKNISDGEIFDLIKKLDLDKIIKNETDLNIFLKENGKNLSGGERQRIGFARALIDKRPILILDEATNALDKKSQAHILNLLAKSNKDRTIIIISHDNEVMNFCDDIINLSE